MRREFELEIYKGRICVAAQFISDIHLGSGRTNPLLAHMLESTGTRKLFLLGDVVDGRRDAGFEERDAEVVGQLLRRADQQEQVTWIGGNHDGDILPALMKDGEDSIFGIKPASATICSHPVGDRYLLLHGHEADRARTPLGVRDKTVCWLVRQHANFQGRTQGGNGWISTAGEIATNTLDRLREKRSDIIRILNEDPSIRGVIMGHWHEQEISLTKRGHLYVKMAGCTQKNCTAVILDKHGSLATLGWHATYFTITEMDKSKPKGFHVRKYSFEECGIKLPSEISVMDPIYVSRANEVIARIPTASQMANRPKMRSFRRRMAVNAVPLAEQRMLSPPMLPK